MVCSSSMDVLLSFSKFFSCVLSAFPESPIAFCSRFFFHISSLFFFTVSSKKNSLFTYTLICIVYFCVLYSCLFFLFSRMLFIVYECNFSLYLSEHINDVFLSHICSSCVDCFQHIAGFFLFAWSCFFMPRAFFRYLGMFALPAHVSGSEMLLQSSACVLWDSLLAVSFTDRPFLRKF